MLTKFWKGVQRRPRGEAFCGQRRVCISECVSCDCRRPRAELQEDLLPRESGGSCGCGTHIPVAWLSPRSLNQQWPVRGWLDLPWMCRGLACCALIGLAPHSGEDPRALHCGWDFEHLPQHHLSLPTGGQPRGVQSGPC